MIHSARANGQNRRSQSKASDENGPLHLDPLLAHSTSREPEGAELINEDSMDINPRRKTIGHLVDDGNSKKSFDKADQDDMNNSKEKVDDVNNEGRESQLFEKAPETANDKNSD